MKTINTDELQQKLENNEVTLIEVLNEREYNKKHIKKAINIPLKTIGFEAKNKFKKNEPIVVYCSDKECSASPTAAKKLEDLGFKNIYDYEGGKKAWEEAGLDME
jgi:rhodanese-related sulfurtransferase